MSLYEMITTILGALGMGSALAAMYIRSTVVNTIMDRFNGKYIAVPNGATQKIMEELEALKIHMDNGFEKVSLRFDRLEDRIEDLEYKYGQRN